MNRLSLAFAAAALMLACGGPLTYKVPATSKANGADALIKADIKKAENVTAIHIDVTNLAPPARITPDATTFVVWGRKNTSNQWSRIGDIVYKEGDRSGQFEGTFPEQELDLEISVEKDRSTAAPSPDILFAQHLGPA
jgi:hypothetical protein